jgi:F-type H+-transporting ATPase subunit delta
MIEGVVKTAFALEPQEKAALEKRLAELLGTPVDLQERLEKALIAGITVEIGGRVMDYSLKGKLALVRRELTKRGSVHDA